MDGATSLGCFAAIVHLVFWSLLLGGRDELSPKWRWGLVLAWPAGWWISSQIPGGGYAFMSLVALADIVLILAVLGGDVRLT
ncbi:MAG TPA: hypothetical protein VGX68_03665 [Thermoanaerobaculia bacterium]|nr:hypothetical protein [Thermoanaerobaculia bacterium]